MEGTSKTRFQRICVFCGFTRRREEAYEKAAIDLGKELVERGIDLVYGGGSQGLLGMVSKVVLDGGRHVRQVVPRALLSKESPGETTEELITVADLHERKAEMAKHADAFIAMPGGYCTLEELMEVVTGAQLGIHHKPIGLLNVDGYYDLLLSFMDEAVEDGFISAAARRILVSASTAKQLIVLLEEFEFEYDEVTSRLVWEEAKE